MTKIVKPKDINEPWEYTYYVRDAQGNVMATYTQLTDKKIDFDNITFNTLNDSIIAKHGAASWRAFMKTTSAISTPYFKNDLIDFIQSSSMGATFLDKWTLAQVITDHPTLITNAWATYTYSARFLTMKSYIGRSQYTTDMLMGICPDLMEQVVSLYTASFESLLSGVDATAYANYMAWKAAPTGTAQAWLCGNVSTASLKACIDGLSNGDFDALLSSLSTSTTAQTWIDLTYSVTQKSECLDAAGHSTWLAAVYAQYSTTDWKAYWTTTNPPSYYDTLLTHFKLQVGYVQDIYGYYTKEDYLLYVKDYYGQAYYDTLVKHFFVASRHYKMVFAAKEFYIYGSSRLGSINANYKLRTTEFDATYSLNGTFTSKTNIKDTIFEAHLKYKTLVRGQRQYELSNHLGNVLAVVSDQWKTNCTPVTVGEEVVFVYENYQATVVQATDYSAFGAPLPGRTYVLSASFKSRYTFNGKESDNEVSGEGNTVDYGFRVSDTRIGRFFSVDPLTKSYPMLTPFQFASNMPIAAIDLDGLEAVVRTYTCTTRNNAKVQLQSYSSTVDKTKPFNESYQLKIDEKVYKVNSLQTLKGRDDRNDKIGDFSNVHELTNDEINKVIGLAHFVFYDLYKGNIEGAVLAESNAGPYKNQRSLLDYKNRLYELLDLKRDELISIDGVAYNANEAGNYLWGMVLTEAGTVLSPQFLGQAGSKIQGRDDEPHEQKAINAGKEKASDIAKSEGDKDAILDCRKYFRNQYLDYMKSGKSANEFKPKL